MALQQRHRAVRGSGRVRARAIAGFCRAPAAQFAAMFVRLAPLLKLCAAITFALLLIDLALFRSGAYARWVIKPESMPGSVVRGALTIEHYRDPTRHNILVLGDSQIGEGLSARSADAASGRDELHFINGSIPGTKPRDWFYLLREIDPDTSQFSAIALMVDYDLAYTQQDLSDYPLDTYYSASLLRLGDLRDFPASFSSSNPSERARRDILLPLQGLHEDARDLLAHPLRRAHEIRKVRPTWIDNLAGYSSRSDTLPDLKLDPSSCMPKYWADAESEWKPKLETYLRDLRKKAPETIQLANQNYERYWLRRIAERYHARGVPVIVFAMARGPWKADFLPSPTLNAALVALRDTGLITPLPGDAFIELEKPQFFYDTLHLNATGRERFSKMFATQIAPLVR